MSRTKNKKHIIKIANLLLTRRCNLKCKYCRISAEIDYESRPIDYPSKQEYYLNEQNYDYWIDVISRLVYHNSDIFFVLYGGEPFLYKDLNKIVDFCNKNGINYTIISSCNSNIQKLIDGFFENRRVRGFSASVDPGFYLDQYSYVDIGENDAVHKAHMGFRTLRKLIKEDKVDDPVAEITVSRHNIQYLEETVKRLSDENITSSITMIEVSPNNYYDFSAISDPRVLIDKNDEIKYIFERLKQSTYKIHMKNQILDTLYNNLPDCYNCKLEEGLHNITVDSDGKIRLCLRIRGRYITCLPNFELLFCQDGINISPVTHRLFCIDKNLCCKGCIWTCPMMSMNDSYNIVNH